MPLTIGVAIAVVLYLILRSPFRYPYFHHSFDVSGKRQPDIDDLIDEWLIEGGLLDLKAHLYTITVWKQDSWNRVNRSLLKPLRKLQYSKAVDDDNAFVFSMIRKQKRYRQKNYVKTYYYVENTVYETAFCFDDLKARYTALEQIGFETTLKKFHSKNQRKLMTKELRHKIMIRDNYTCRLCGKYMPDEVGLHIDHIVPIAKGGKSVESNLQVLCSKCNGSKSDKLI